MYGYPIKKVVGGYFFHQISIDNGQKGYRESFEVAWPKIIYELLLG
jgi:hypothetical protein